MYNVNQKFSAVKSVSTEVKYKLDKTESRTISIENNLKEFWNTGEEMGRLRVAYNNETDNFKKLKLSSPPNGDRRSKHKSRETF